MPYIPTRAIGFAWFRREDYPRIRQIMADADEMPPTWEKWFYGAEKRFKHLAQHGIAIEKVVLDPDVFSRWCEARGLNIDAEARSTFAGEVVARKHPSQD